MSHFHLFTIPVVALILSHLLYGTAARPRVRIGLTVVLYAGALLDVVGPWAIRYLSAGFAYVLLLGWLLLGGGLLAVVVYTLFAMWLPSRVRPAVLDADNGADRP